MPERIDVTKLLDKVVDMNASDMHMLVGEPPTLRIHGHLQKLEEYGQVTPEQTEQFMRDIAPARSLAEVEEVQGADFGYTFGDRARFRVAIFMQKGSVALNMRLIPFKLLSFEEIGLDKRLQRLLYAPRGLFLVTGPTGSGKTTTLATMVDYINEHRDCHIITIEDPIEYYHTPKKSIISQREVGNDVPSFAIGVIKALRQDPDVILVGEMRDLATISAAVTAAETGHLVFSTLHTTGSARTVDRIVDVFPFDQQDQIRTQLSSNLICVLSQLLLPRRDGNGRIAVFETMVATPAIQHLIRDKKTYSIFSAIQTGQQLGMNTLDHSLWDRYQRGLIERDEMLRAAEKPEELLEKLGERKPEVKT
ncbi:MAG TPA: type IV pilus twitching motility protein PilT [Armatimonadota bacterium]|nr:type IV pilus twitching motility protein PilT [Armatimonadota bacterium]